MRPMKIINDIGLIGAISHYFVKILAKFGLHLNLKSIKANQVRRLSRSIGDTVKYGSFKGLSLVDRPGWSANDRISMLVGAYELRVLEILLEATSNRTCFIDIGAADGYFAVGMATQSNITVVHAFEIDDRARILIKQNSMHNNVLGKVNIHGEACANEISEIVAIQNANSVILIDIEGAEFQLLKNQCLLKNICNEILIIELHDFLFEDGAARKQALFDDFSVYFDCFIFDSGPRDVSKIEELKRLPEDIAWLILSEGRLKSMNWVVCLPKNDRCTNISKFDYLNSDIIN